MPKLQRSLRENRKCGVLRNNGLKITFGWHFANLQANMKCQATIDRTKGGFFESLPMFLKAKNNQEGKPRVTKN